MAYSKKTKYKNNTQNVVSESYMNTNLKNRLINSLSGDNPVPLWKRDYKYLQSYNAITNFYKKPNEINGYSFRNLLLLEEGGIFCTFLQARNLNKEEDINRAKSETNFKLPINLNGKTSKGEAFFVTYADTLYIDKKHFKDKSKEEINKMYTQLIKDQQTVAECNKKQLPFPDDIQKKFKDKFYLMTPKKIITHSYLFKVEDINGLDKEWLEKQQNKWKDFNKLQLNRDIDLSIEERGDMLLNGYLKKHPEIELQVQGITPPHYGHTIPTEIDPIMKRTLALPVKESCSSLSAYYSIVFHEIAHSTMHNKGFESRSTEEKKNAVVKKYDKIFAELQKEKIKLKKQLHVFEKAGEKEFAKETEIKIEEISKKWILTDQEKTESMKSINAEEELVAEMSANLVCSYIGALTPETEENNFAYCANWKKAIKNFSEDKIGTIFDESCKIMEEMVQIYDNCLKQKELDKNLEIEESLEKISEKKKQKNHSVEGPQL